jgi:UDP-N-acetyl-D-galactosamine dehydrogenase
MSAERIAVVGLGYVGLPLAVALSSKFDVIGFDINPRRIEALRNGSDWTKEISPEELRESKLRLTDVAEDLRGCDLFIATVPTPIDKARRPDFEAILAACDIIGPVLARGAIVVFESTVYPGVTEEICGPALERASALRCGVDFKIGYSPERINPGDKERPLTAITKIVSGQDEETLERLAAIYGAVVDAGIHRASSIKVAEAAKVIENTQRDVNIALMNEISKICDLIGISTSEVLAAAGTKWNFLKFYPGLVGGHCIGVDPYYLTAKAEELGYHPQVILSGRRINDGMGAYIAQRMIKLLAQMDGPMRDARVGILGLTFKENVPDIRNSKVLDIYNELRAFGIEPMVHDPLADPDEVRRACGFELREPDSFGALSALILAVAHDDYLAMGPDRLSAMIGEGGLLVDVRSKIDPAALRPDIAYWSL